MANPRRSSDLETVGSDSFLDIVANLVGILIIMVMLVGVRIKHAPEADVEPPPAVDPSAETAESLARALAERKSLEQESLDVARQANLVAQTAELTQRERNRLALLAEQGRREVAARRGQAAAEQEQAESVAQRIEAAERKAVELDSRLRQARNQQPPTVSLLDFPTPISATVHGEEIHFQLRGGRVAAVPIDALVDRIRSQSQQILWKLREQAEVGGTVGPIDGFRMKYTFEKVSVPTETEGIGRGARVVAGGSYAQLQEFVLAPEAAELGEPLAAALGNTSQFRSRLASGDPAKLTVTLWIYPDSFEAFRQVRQELHRLGYQVAARPLPDGAPISGSPQGSRSVTQ